MLSSAESHTARWFASLFHQYSLSVEHWRVLADTKNLEFDHLRNTLRALETERSEVTSKQEWQARVLTDQRNLLGPLEKDLERRRDSEEVVLNGAVSMQALERPGTPWPPELALSCSSSDLSSTSPRQSPAPACTDLESLAVKKRAAGWESDLQNDRPSKRQHTEAL